MKQAVIVPSMLAVLYPLSDPVEGYAPEEFEQDTPTNVLLTSERPFEAGRHTCRSISSRDANRIEGTRWRPKLGVG
jgi:hypothetical protein